MKYIVEFDDNHNRIFYDTLSRDSEYHAQCSIEKHGGYYKVMTEKQFPKYLQTTTANWLARQKKIMEGNYDN